jgi:hypothetical protein
MSIMRRYSRFVPVLALFVVMAAFVSGCGSSDKPLTKAEFLRRANANCAGKDSQNLRKQLPANPTRAQIAKLDLEKTLPLLNRQLDKIAALKPPTADRDRVQKIIEQVRADARAFAKGLRENPEKALAPGVNPFAKSNFAAKLYGLKICAS